MAKLEEEKERKPIISIILSLLAIIGCFAANFPEYMMGTPATLKNVVVTALYIVLWIYAFYFAKYNNRRKTWWFYFIFWGLTLASAIMYLYVTLTDRLADGYMFAGIAFIGQFYGLGFFLGTSIVFYSAIIAISVIMTIASTTV
jgi:hypothetical protein